MIFMLVTKSTFLAKRSLGLVSVKFMELKDIGYEYLRHCRMDRDTPSNLGCDDAGSAALNWVVCCPEAYSLSA